MTSLPPSNNKLLLFLDFDKTISPCDYIAHYEQALLTSGNNSQLAKQQQHEKFTSISKQFIDKYSLILNNYYSSSSSNTATTITAQLFDDLDTCEHWGTSQLSQHFVFKGISKAALAAIGTQVFTNTTNAQHVQHLQQVKQLFEKLKQLKQLQANNAASNDNYVLAYCASSNWSFDSIKASLLALDNSLLVEKYHNSSSDQCNGSSCGNAGSNGRFRIVVKSNDFKFNNNDSKNNSDNDVSSGEIECTCTTSLAKLQFMQDIVAANEDSNNGNVIYVGDSLIDIRCIVECYKQQQQKAGHNNRNYYGIVLRDISKANPSHLETIVKQWVKANNSNNSNNGNSDDGNGDEQQVKELSQVIAEDSGNSGSRGGGIYMANSMSEVVQLIEKLTATTSETKK